MQLRRIVVGIEFTEASLAAVRWVARHLAPEAEIILVHVVSEPRVPSFLRGLLPPPVARLGRSVPSLDGALRGLAGLVGPERVHVELLAGVPADALAMIAEEVGADLVCVGRSVSRRGSARFGGTTTQRLLARTRVPIMVVASPPPGAPTRILAGIDDRPGGDVVLGASASLAATWHTPLDVLHVIEQEVQDLLRGTGPLPDEWDERRLFDGVDDRRVLRLAHDWVASVLADEAVPGDATPLVRTGDAGQQIIATARRNGADVIVVGRGGDESHAPLPAGALCLGSTTRLVLWAAPCPVLILPLDGSARSRLQIDPRGRRVMRTRGRAAMLDARRRAAAPLLPRLAGPDDAA